MATRRQRIRNRAYKIVWADNSGSTAFRDTDAADYAATQKIAEYVLANYCPILKKDIMA